MDHSEGQEGQRSSLPPQDQLQHLQQQQQQQQQQQAQQQPQPQPQQQAQVPQAPIYRHQHHPLQQPQWAPGAAAVPQPYSQQPRSLYQQQDLPQQQQQSQQAQHTMSAAAAAAMPRPHPQGQGELEYQQAAGTAGLYPYPQAAAAAHYGGYPRQGYPPQQHPPMYYQPPPPSQYPQPPQQQQPPVQQQRVLGVGPMMGVGEHVARHHPSMPPVIPVQQQQQQQQPYLQPKAGRLPSDRPLIKLSVSLIDTYKHINTVYYEEREARRAARAKDKSKSSGTTSAAEGAQGVGTGTHNHGWDDENYDYIVTSGELFYGRYRIKERIGKGSFGQVVRAEDVETRRDVAIKIIKSKKPFLIQAKTEIELLTHLNEKDVEDQHNIVRLLTHFMYRNHQCLVFEMLSLNLYELLKNTQFGGVSLNLIRKFSKQVLKSLLFLARRDVDIIHCDLKPENILLRHPKKSGVKVIDFGSSCRSNKRMYSYIQSRFYRSPEVMLGLPYSVAIDMWSLGCILAEMHTGEPLFSGSDQFDQMQKIVKILGMVPTGMLDQASDQHRLQFFERQSRGIGVDEWTVRQVRTASSSSSSRSSSQQQQQQQPKQVVVPSRDPVASLTEVICSDTQRKKKFPPSEARNTAQNYEMFIDLIHRMLAYDPEQRIKPAEALNHPFITFGEQPQPHSSSPAYGAPTSVYR